MTDLFLLLLLPGAGDELQGIKRGIVEMADLLAVNKADGDRLRLARQARAHYLNAVHLLPAKPSGYAPQVLECSAEQGTGIPELWLAMETYRQQVTENGFLVKNRRQQAAYWFKEALQEGLQSLFFQQAEIKEKLAALEPLIQEGKVSPFSAAHDLLQIFMLKKM